MDIRTEEVLAVIDARLAEGDSDLWNILTAFRGPDVDSSYSLKSKYTCTVRAAALPLTATAHREGRMFIADFGTSAPSPAKVEATKQMAYRAIDEGPEGIAHYISHVGNALYALCR